VLIDSESESVPGSASLLAAPPPSVPATPAAPAEPPVQNIHMRSLIVTQDASIIIGRAGAHVNEIRVSDTKLFLGFVLIPNQERSNARVTVSESIPGNPERILNVSGALDAVAKVG
jgi:heterogeneous nuclear rnp K-like protein 2